MSDELKVPESNSMLSRFAGASGKELLRDILSDTSLLRGTGDIDEFIAGCEVLDVSVGTELIRQGASDNSIYLILSGSFDIRVNDRFVTTRRVGAHVGEMALIDPTARRSASVVAAEHSLVMKSTEECFSTFANAHPPLWRRIAVELSRRLAERNKLIKPPRAEPVVFIACSTEALSLAREVQAIFDHDSFVVEIWIDGVFNPSKTPIEDLADLISRIDFAVILLTPDDKILARESETFSPRDNVVLELGLAIGAIGRERTLLLLPRKVDFRIPSDLLGVKPIDYPQGSTDTIKSRLGPACNEIRKIVNRLGPL